MTNSVTEEILTTAWTRQVKRLMDQKYPQAINLKDSDFYMRMVFLRDALLSCLEFESGSFSIGDSNIPLLIVFPPSVINYAMQLRLNKLDPQFYHVKLHEVNNAEANTGYYTPYIILDVEINDKLTRESPRYSEGILKIRQRRGLNFEEGIALLRVLSYDYPEIKAHNQVILTETQYGDPKDGLMACLDFVKSSAMPIIDYVSSVKPSIWNAIVSRHQLAFG